MRTTFLRPRAAFQAYYRLMQGRRVTLIDTGMSALQAQVTSPIAATLGRKKSKIIRSADLDISIWVAWTAKGETRTNSLVVFKYSDDILLMKRVLALPLSFRGLGGLLPRHVLSITGV